MPYRKIDPRIWNDAAFQRVWANRSPAKLRVPKSLASDRRSDGAFSPAEVASRSTRLAFAKAKKRLWPDVIRRFGARCLACGATQATVPDHVLPIAWGGTNDVANLQPLCAACNGSKGGCLPESPESVRA